MDRTFVMGDVQVSFIYILLVLRSVGSAFHVPAMQASVPLLAPESELMRIAGINQVIQSLSVIAGPALAALLKLTWHSHSYQQKDWMYRVLNCKQKQ